MNVDEGENKFSELTSITLGVTAQEKFRVTNIGETDIDSYGVYFEEIINTFTRTEDLVISLTCKEYDASGNYVKDCNGIDTSFPTENQLLVTNSILKGYRHEYVLNFEYKSLSDVNQDVDVGKTLSGIIQIQNEAESVSLTGTVTGYSNGDYIEIQSDPKVSQIKSDDTYKITALDVGSHTVYLKDSNGSVKASKQFRIIKSTDGTESVSDDGTEIYITDTTEEVLLNITYENSVIILAPGVTGTLLAKKILADNVDPLTNNQVPSDSVNSTYVNNPTPGINFGTVSSYNNGKGLYSTSTNTQNNKPTYYFRGNVNNNYVKFGRYNKGTCTVDYEGQTLTVQHKDSRNPSALECETETIYQYNAMAQVLAVGYDSVDECSNSYEGSMVGGCTELSMHGVWNSTVNSDLYWRIVRINEDGSIRLIYYGIEDDFYSDSETGAEYPLGYSGVEKSAFNTSYITNDNAYVGYMYGLTNSEGYQSTHSNIDTSTIKRTVDNWYMSDTNLVNLSEKYLADSGFCNDRSVSSTVKNWHSSDTTLGYGTNITYYGAYNRLYNNKSPQFACPNPDNDLFTTNTSTNGNKSLKYPIGLITADEVAYAGGVFGQNSMDFYLAYGDNFSTMSPFNYNNNFYVYTEMGYDGGPSETETYMISEYLSSTAITDSSVVRPVINLKSNVVLSEELPSGCESMNGTADCPYIIKTD